MSVEFCCFTGTYQFLYRIDLDEFLEMLSDYHFFGYDSYLHGLKFLVNDTKHFHLLPCWLLVRFCN